MVGSVGTLNEQPLHAALKEFYQGRGGRLEVNIDGYIIDVVHHHQLIEIQTQHFYAIKKKIFKLIENYSLVLVFPVAQQKWLLKLPQRSGEKAVRRKSPKEEAPYGVFAELVSFPELVSHPRFRLDVVMVEVEEVRQYSGEKPWRQNGWVTVEQRLERIHEIHQVQQPADLWHLLPETLPGEFTTSDLRHHAGMPLWLAQKTAYCLKKAGAVHQAGRRGRYNLYRRIVDNNETYPGRFR